MDFALQDDQQALLDLATAIFADHCDDDAARKFAETGAAYDKDLWRAVAEAGLLGIGVPESAGGHGFGMIETALLLEAAGKALAPVPLRETLVCAQTLAADGGADNAEWPHNVVAGLSVLASACDEPVGGWLTPALTASRKGDGWVLTGSKPAVAWGMEADGLLVSATIAGSQQAGLFLVKTDAPGLSRSPQQGTDRTPLAQLDFAGVEVPASALIGDEAVLKRHLGRMRVALAASQLGIAGEALRRTAEYTAGRVQFGRPIGSMQAVQQRAADGYMDVEAMRSTLWRAAYLIDEGTFDETEIAAAKWWADVGGHRVTHTAQHQHGGMGADVTYPIHRFFLAAKAVENTLGAATPMLAELGALIAAGKARRLTAIGSGHNAV